MANTDRLGSRINDAFDAIQKRVEQFHVEAEKESKAITQRHERFETLRQRLREEIFEPRLQMLLERFDNIKTKLQRSRDGGELTMSFLKTPERPANVELVFRLSHDDRVENVILECDVRIVPLFMKIDRHDPRFEFSLDRPNDEAIAVWLENQIVSFVRTYLSIQFANEYQKENLVTDVVANIRFPKGLAKATVQRDNHTYYFASEESSRRFEKDPSPYITGG